MIRRASRVALTIFAAGVLLACPPPQAIVLFNNSGVPLSVEHGDEVTPWGIGQILGIGTSKDGLDWDELEWRPLGESGANVPILTIVDSGQRREYALLRASLPEEFVDRASPTITARYQLQPDKALYAVRVGEDFPTDDLQAQPPEFPIRPEGTD